MVTQSAETVEYPDFTSAEVKTPSVIVLDMPLNNLMVRFMYCWSFGK